jgi:hypothetical protein
VIVDEMGDSLSRPAARRPPTAPESRPEKPKNIIKRQTNSFRR